jgi:hypothetical protein
LIATQVAATVVPAAAPTAGLGAALAPTLMIAGTVVGAVVVAAGAVVLTRAAMSGLARLGDHVEESHRTWAAQQAQLDDWEATYAKVVASNARLNRVRGRLSRSGGGDLPGPISPAGLIGRPREKVDELCAEVDRHVLLAEQILLQRAVDDAIRQIPAGARAASTGRLAERLRTRMAGRTQPAGPAAPMPVPSPRGGSDLTGTVEAVVAGVEQDATAADCAKILAIAGRVTAAGPGAAKAHLDDLYLTVNQVNQAAVARRTGADRAARYLEGLRGEVNSVDLIAPERLAHHAGLRRSLQDVVDGEREFDSTLAGRAEDALAEVREMAEQLLKREAWRAVLGDLGYTTTVDEQAAGTHFAAMTVKHKDWARPGVRLVVAGDETRAVVTGDAAQLRKWATDVMKIDRKEFADRGVELGRIQTTKDAIPPVRTSIETPVQKPQEPPKRAEPDRVRMPKARRLGE